MKIKDMIKKIDTYNEIADIVVAPKMELHFKDKLGCGGYQIVRNYRQFSRFIRNEYIDIVANAILNGEYEFEKVSIFTVEDNIDVAVSFEIYDA